MKLLTVFIFTLFLTSCSSTEKGPTFDGVSLGSCPDSPNCISSVETRESHYTEKLVYTGDRAETRGALLSILKTEENSEIVISTDEYIHVVYRSKFFRFKDDLEFHLPSDEKAVHMRSAARSGYTDFGVNRKRVERIKKKFYSLTGK